MAGETTPQDEGTETTAAPAKPVLRVVRGDLTPEELAALVAVVAARNAAAAHA
ncbi:acyl-CoA carboxylase epsilon subunit, partial [Aeromicrobium sp. CnD17-E]